MRVGAHGGGVDKDLACCFKSRGHKVLPQTPPHASRLPAAKAHVHGVPVTELHRQVPPRTAGTAQVQDGFEKVPVAHCPVCSGSIRKEKSAPSCPHTTWFSAFPPPPEYIFSLNCSAKSGALTAIWFPTAAPLWTSSNIRGRRCCFIEERK